MLSIKGKHYSITWDESNSRWIGHIIYSEIPEDAEGKGRPEVSVRVSSSFAKEEVMNWVLHHLDEMLIEQEQS